MNKLPFGVHKIDYEDAPERIKQILRKMDEICVFSKNNTETPQIIPPTTEENGNSYKGVDYQTPFGIGFYTVSGEIGKRFVTQTSIIREKTAITDLKVTPDGSFMMRINSEALDETYETMLKIEKKAG